jgi:U3 small nucleolar RNA-associated protein 11
MMSSKVDSKGIKIADRGNKSLSVDVVKLLKTQDAGYIRTMLQMVRKEREQLEEQIVVEKEGVKAFKDGIEERKSSHLVFVDDEQQQKAYRLSTSGLGTKQAIVPKEQGDNDLEERKPKQLSRKQHEAMQLAEKEEWTLLRKREKAQERKVAHLEHVKAQEADLVAAEEELEAQRAKMNNIVGGTNKNGVKFKIRERKR